MAQPRNPGVPSHVRPGRGAGLAALAVAGVLAIVPACSGSAPRDMFFGTDAGLDFEVPQREAGPDVPDAGNDTSDDSAAVTQPDAADDSADSSDAAAD